MNPGLGEGPPWTQSTTDAPVATPVPRRTTTPARDVGVSARGPSPVHPSQTPHATVGGTSVPRTLCTLPRRRTVTPTVRRSFGARVDPVTGSTTHPLRPSFPSRHGEGPWNVGLPASLPGKRESRGVTPDYLRNRSSLTVSPWDSEGQAGSVGEGVQGSTGPRDTEAGDGVTSEDEVMGPGGQDSDVDGGPEVAVPDAVSTRPGASRRPQVPGLVQGPPTLLSTEGSRPVPGTCPCRPPSHTPE